MTTRISKTIDKPIPILSGKERQILELLRNEELFGQQFIERSGGALKKGTVYVTLARMVDKGYVKSRIEALEPGVFGLPRRWYRPTSYGISVLEAWTVVCQLFAALPPTRARVSARAIGKQATVAGIIVRRRRSTHSVRTKGSRSRSKVPGSTLNS